MRLWGQISFARCWFDRARVPCCWCSHDRNRLADLLAGEPAEAGTAIAAHARRLFDCAGELSDE